MAKSRALGAADRFRRGRRGIWGMTILTVRNIMDRSIVPATEGPQTKKPANGKRASELRGLGDVELAIRRDLAALPDDLAGSGLAATAIALARAMDDNNSATSKSMCARAILELTDRLRALAPADEEDDALDGLQADYTTRLRSVG